MSPKRHIETFDQGPGGRYGWSAEGVTELEFRDGAAISRSPWWVNFNHAPPGGGYLHILFAVNTLHGVPGESRFIDNSYPTDFTDARCTFRIKGELQPKGSQLVLLVQSDITEPVKTRVNSVLASQPIEVTPEWSE